MVDIKSTMIFSGNANKPLAKMVAQNLGMTLGKASVKTFSDGEISVEIEENVRGQDVYIIQPLCDPVNNNLMEVLIMADALKRSSVERISVVLPYFGYSRQDRRARSARVPITAKVVANMLTVMGVERLLTIDLHADQIQGFFDIPVDNIYSAPVLLGNIWKRNFNNLVVVSPDVGGVVRARALAKRLDCDLAIIDKRRPKPNVASVMNIIGDIRDRTCIIIDDIIDTANTLCEGAKALNEAGAKEIYAFATHPVLSGPAVERISNSYITEVVVTDTIELSESARNCDKIRQLSIAPLLAETIRRISNEESVSSLFMD